jgi:hypothetical protein
MLLEGVSSCDVAAGNVDMVLLPDQDRMAYGREIHRFSLTISAQDVDPTGLIAC